MKRHRGRGFSWARRRGQRAQAAREDGGGSGGGTCEPLHHAPALRDAARPDGYLKELLLLLCRPRERASKGRVAGGLGLGLRNACSMLIRLGRLYRLSQTSESSGKTQPALLKAAQHGVCLMMNFKPPQCSQQ